MLQAVPHAARSRRARQFAATFLGIREASLIHLDQAGQRGFVSGYERAQNRMSPAERSAREYAREPGTSADRQPFQHLGTIARPALQPFGIGGGCEREIAERPLAH